MFSRHTTAPASASANASATTSPAAILFASGLSTHSDCAGFERWNKIYGETDDVNKVQKDIRDGHAQTVDKVLAWFDADGVKGKTVCDCGCGTGSLAIPTALRGAAVTASDISASMVGEAEKRYKAEVAKGAPHERQLLNCIFCRILQAHNILVPSTTVYLNG